MKVAIVRVRGDVRIRHDVRKTFETLSLNQKNHCAIVEDTPITRGMIQVVSPFVTWGPVDEKALAALKKRGGDNEKVFRLNPPRKGYGRKGIKIAFSRGGALGDRKEKINDLLLRMV